MSGPSRPGSHEQPSGLHASEIAAYRLGCIEGGEEPLGQLTWVVSKAAAMAWGTPGLVIMLAWATQSTPA